MEQFNGAGIPSGIIKGDMSSHERKQIIDNLTSGKIMNMVSVDVVSEGFDLPSVETGILLRKTQSLSLCLQQIGRILRPSEGKTAVILDHVGNLKTHGLAEDEREWTLEGITKKTKKTESGTHTQCEDCYCMFDKLEPACPECGWVKPKPTAKDFEHSDEDLVEIRRKPLQILLRDVKTREELFVIAKIRKYHHGWVNHIARELKIL
jgi:superfamily II DNA or RNA helicase